METPKLFNALFGTGRGRGTAFPCLVWYNWKKGKDTERKMKTITLFVVCLMKGWQLANGLITNLSCHNLIEILKVEYIN